MQASGQFVQIPESDSLFAPRSAVRATLPGASARDTASPDLHRTGFREFQTLSGPYYFSQVLALNPMPRPAEGNLADPVGFCTDNGSIAGIIASTGKRSESSTSLSVLSDVSCISRKRASPSPRANPPPNPPRANRGRFGKEGLSGKLAGSSTRNCSPS